MSADTDRQNALLCLAYQSKMYGLAGIGGYRRGVNMFADGFSTTTGIDPVLSRNYVFDNIAGLVAPTIGYGSNLSTSSGAIGGVLAPANGSFAQTADGITTGTNGCTSGESSGGVPGVSYVGQNFATPRHIRQMVLWQGYAGAADRNVTSAIARYSDNGSVWTALCTVSPAAILDPQPFALPASGPHEYWSLLANSVPGASNRWGITELQMMEATGGANMTLVSVAQPADVAVSNGRILLEIDNAAGLTWNTDVTAEVTCDGVNWAMATLAPAGIGQSGRIVVETNDQACTAGTSFAGRIKSFGKSVPIYALTVSAH